MDLPPDWSEFFRLLISRRVRFLIVGAHALAAHGRPRATADLDVLVEPSKRNARLLCAARRRSSYRRWLAPGDAEVDGEGFSGVGGEEPPISLHARTVARTPPKSRNVAMNATFHGDTGPVVERT